MVNGVSSATITSVLKMRRSSNCMAAECVRHTSIQRGWCFGNDIFLKVVLERLDGSLQSVRRDSVSGDEVAMHDETRLIALFGLVCRP